jgi:hypothetical protein
MWSYTSGRSNRLSLRAHAAKARFRATTENAATAEPQKNKKPINGSLGMTNTRPVTGISDMGEYADDAIDRDMNSMFDADYWGEDNWGIIVRHCRKKTPYSFRTKNERTFAKFVNRPVDYRDF